MSLRKQARAKAAETTKATKKIGFVGQVILQAGIVARFAKAAQKPQCFAAYSDEAEEITRANAVKLAKKATGQDHTDFMPALWVQVIPDTSLTPTSRYQGSFVDLKVPASNARDQGRPGDFILDHMSEEFDDDTGKKFWAHIAWVRMTEDYGGDLTRFGDDANNELSMLVTYLPNKRAATDLVKALREGTVTMDSLATARNYDVVGVRKTLSENAAAAKEGVKAEAAPVLTDIGTKTKVTYDSLSYFTEPKTLEFLQNNYEKAKGDIEVAADKSGTEPGDLAIVLNKPQYFKDLMDQTELGEQEALVKVAADTGLAHAADLARLLEIDEAPF